MAGLFDNIDWGGLLKAGVGLAAGNQNAGANTKVANNYAQNTKFNPYNIATGNAGVAFNGNNAVATLSPQYQQLQGQLTSGASGLLGGASQFYQNGGGTQQLGNEFNQYNNSQNNPLATQFNQNASGFLSGLGQVNPNQLSSDYTANLRAQANPGNQRAADSLASRLFATGGLGSSGGANLMGGLQEAQDQQDLGFQLAGKQYAGQEQSRMAGLAQGFAQQGDQLQNSTNVRATQRFQNAMQLFGAGQQNAQGQNSAGLGMLNGSLGLDQNLLNTIQMGGYLGGAQSNANATAYGPGVVAGQDQNNTASAGWQQLLGASGLLGKAGDAIGGLFGGDTSGLGAVIGGAGGYGSQASNDLLNNWGGSQDPTFGLFNGAGGQAADTSGNGLIGGGYNFLGGSQAISNGLQNISPPNYSGMNDQQLQQALGSTGAMKAIDNGGALGKTAGIGGSALGIYQGLDKGGVKGYGQAVAGAANLAGALGYGGSTASTAGMLGNLASGNYAGALSTAGAATGSSVLSGLGAAAGAAGLATAFVAAGSALAHALNGQGDEKRNNAAFTQALGDKLQTADGMAGRTATKFYNIPGVGWVDNKEYQDIAGVWYGAVAAPDGNQAEWKQKLTDKLASVKPITTAEQLNKYFPGDFAKKNKGLYDQILGSSPTSPAPDPTKRALMGG